MRALLVVLLLSGCAQDRYLTKEADATMRERCEPGGCVVIPRQLWQQIETLLKGLHGA